MKATLLLLSMLTIMAAGIVAPSMPAIAQLFHTIPNAPLLAKLLLTVPALFIALTASLAGLFIDRRGRLKLLYTGLVLYAAGGSTGYYLNDIYQMLMGRALLGVGIGIIITITVTLIADYFKGEERKQFIGYHSVFIGFAGIIFVSIGGILADISWRLPFLVYLFPLLLIPMVAIFLREPTDNGHSVAISYLMPRGLILLLLVNGFVLMVLMYIVPTQIPFLLKAIGIKENYLSGAVLATHSLGIVTSSSLYARIKSKWPFPLVFVLAYLTMAVGYFFTGKTATLAPIFVAMFAAGFGFGLLITNTNFWVMETAPAQLRGTVIGLLNTCLFLGQFFSPIMSEPIVAKAGLPFLFIASAILMIALSLAIGGAYVRSSWKRSVSSPKKKSKRPVNDLLPDDKAHR